MGSEMMDGMLYRSGDNGFTPIGKVSEIQTTTLFVDADDELSDLVMPWDMEFTIDLTLNLLDGYSKKKVRMFRKVFGIDLVPLKFPRKKNRRKKRLYRRARKLIMEIGRIK